jgi:hypothetical protein
MPRSPIARLYRAPPKLTRFTRLRHASVRVALSVCSMPNHMPVVDARGLPGSRVDDDQRHDERDLLNFS